MYRRVWIVNCSKRGFTYKIFVETNEAGLRSYMESEIPEAYSYSGATEKEVAAWKTLGLPIYLYKDL